MIVALADRKTCWRQHQSDPRPSQGPAGSCRTWVLPGGECPVSGWTFPAGGPWWPASRSGSPQRADRCCVVPPAQCWYSVFSSLPDMPYYPTCTLPTKVTSRARTTGIFSTYFTLGRTSFFNYYCHILSTQQLFHVPLSTSYYMVYLQILLPLDCTGTYI
jgi:hypothetical protein